MHQKDRVTLDNIKQDLSQVAALNFKNITSWRMSFILPTTLIAILIGLVSYIVFSNIWIGVLISLISLYHIIQYLIACKKYMAHKKAIRKALTREDVCISVECLNHISKETIYEPHILVRGHVTKEAHFLNFRSLRRWRILIAGRFYSWSKDYSMSAYSLESTSIPGDEFIYVSLQPYQNIACIYPCKYFVLDENLRSDNY